MGLIQCVMFSSSVMFVVLPAPDFPIHRQNVFFGGYLNRMHWPVASIDVLTGYLGAVGLLGQERMFLIVRVFPLP